MNPSLWIDTLPQPIVRRQRLDTSRSVDVAIVGGGFTGLWTAYYLAKLDPSLDILVIEREYCGFGASGRNGGWCIGELAVSLERLAKISSLDAGLRLWRAAFDSVDEVGRVTEAEGIDCGYAKGGTIRVARNQPQAKRQREEIDHLHSLGITEDELRLVDSDEAKGYLNATDVLGGIFHAPSAALDPGRLVRGLADAAERLGVTIVEGTAVTDVQSKRVVTEDEPGQQYTVTAEVVVQATEAYTRDLPGQKRTLVPVYSLMIATEPLPDSVIEEIGLADRSTFADDRYMVIYGQRTEDNRLAFGGRGVPYSFGSGISRAKESQPKYHRMIHESLVDLLPQVAGAAVTHRWGGVLAVPRDWTPAVRFDRSTGMGVAGGYVGEGVAAANLAGRTLAELIADVDSERTDLPWVNHEWPTWEPEPFRWLGVRGGRALLGAADIAENRSQNEAKLAVKLASLIRG